MITINEKINWHYEQNVKCNKIKLTETLSTMSPLSSRQVRKAVLHAQNIFKAMPQLMACH